MDLLGKSIIFYILIKKKYILNFIVLPVFRSNEHVSKNQVPNIKKNHNNCR